MAYSRNYNTIKSQAQMTRTLGYPAAFRGVDVTSPERSVSDLRFAYAMNMWKDYDSEGGACIETFPGWRQVRGFGNAIYGMWRYGDYVMVHTGDALKAFKHSQRDGSTSSTVIASGLQQKRSSGFVANNAFWHLDGSSYRKITWNGSSWSSSLVTASAYAPTLYASHTTINGNPAQYEQRNMLTNSFKESFVVKEDDVTVLAGTFGIVYTILSAAERTVKATASGLTDATVIIPGTITLAGEEYTVTDVGSFGTNTNCTTVWFGEGIQRIADNAFHGYSHLANVHFPSSLLYVGSRAFDTAVSTVKVYVYPSEIDDEESNMQGALIAKLRICSDAFTIVTMSPTVYTSGNATQLGQIKTVENPTADPFFYDEDWNIVTNYTLPEFPAAKYVIQLYTDWTSISSVTLAGATIGTNTSAAKYRGTIADYYKTGYPALYIVVPSIDDLIGRDITITGTQRDASISGTSYANCINGCTIAAEFDGRIFLGGNPSFPNRIWYTQRDINGINRPEYVGELNYWQDGAAGDTNVSMLVASNMLCVMQKQTDGRGGIYLHTGADTGSDLTPRVYPSMFGSLESAPCGACCDFRDEAVFLTTHGLDALAKQTVNLERSIEHRSTNVDNLLRRETLSTAEMVEWNGYLVLLCESGNVYMADSRQIARNESSGYAEYEWYLLDELGVYYPMTQAEGSDEMTGGTFYRARVMLATEGVLYFGNIIGQICCINTDKRGQSYTKEIVPVPAGEDDETEEVVEPVDPGRIHRHWYTRCGRRYSSCLTTKFDDCNYPHVTKNTVRKSVDVELRTYTDSDVHLKWRTERQNAWAEEAFDGAWSNRFGFYEMDFGNGSIDTAEHKIAVSDEHAKLWVMKQYHIRSDAYQSRWGLYHISYRWQVARRIRN